MFNRIKNLKKAKGLLEYAKKMGMNPTLIKADIGLDIMKLKSRVRKANKLNPLDKAVMNEYISDLEKLDKFILNPKQSKEIIYLCKHWKEKYGNFEQVIDKILGDKR
jgi:hypothetical protein